MTQQQIHLNPPNPVEASSKPSFFSSMSTSKPPKSSNPKKRRTDRGDSVNMPQFICSNCISSNVECTHRGTMTKDEYSPISMQSLIKEILTSSPHYCVPDSKEVVQQMIIDLATYSCNLENRISTLVKKLSAMNSQVLVDAPTLTDKNAKGGYYSDDNNSVRWLSGFMSNISIQREDDGRKKKKRFFGNSSTMAFT
ncbi:hypothetical protein K435DRAFT_807536 [Dendrothele bispora CBS 962.96]|uniref:Zn(2)-C6 fungal-type domain-containing protein n=1 Tax=Dendrothele bispora (strain CBS 962.96) TaxID=1314807 RepID=A0A4S8L4T3_DENBC|nr:hypothetical protein K435DRAFT_807536 [Dendrothele bispora CBS 962.96]